MNVTLYLVLGGFIGLFTTLLIQMKGPLNYLFNISLGIFGAFVAGWIFTPLFGISTVEPIYFSVPALLISLGGTVILLVGANFLRWGAERRTG